MVAVRKDPVRLAPIRTPDPRRQTLSPICQRTTLKFVHSAFRPLPRLPIFNF